MCAGHHSRNSDTDGRRKKENQENGHRTRKWSDTYLLGVGGNNTRAIVDTLQNDDFTGVDAILSVVPYYNKPSQEGIYQHYKAIAEATELPIVLYNVPGRTGVNMKAETTLRIARDFKNVIAIKEASGDITQMDISSKINRPILTLFREMMVLPSL